MNKMNRPLAPILALTIIVACPVGGALADDAKEKAATFTTEQTPQPKIRVILPASWEPAIPETSSQPTSPQRSAAR
jgi:hypothetical protein